MAETHQQPEELDHSKLERPIIGISGLKNFKEKDPQKLVNFVSQFYQIPLENFDISPKKPAGTGYSRGTIGLNSTIASTTIAEYHDTGENAGQWMFTETGILLLLKGTKDQLAFSDDEIKYSKSIKEVRTAIDDMIKLDRRQRGLSN